MKLENEVADIEDITKVFRELNIEDADSRAYFQQLAELSEQHAWEKTPQTPQDTRNNTLTEDVYSNAELESDP